MTVTAAINEIYAKIITSLGWYEIGSGSASDGGISNNGTESTAPSVGADSAGNPVTAWQDCDGMDCETYIRRFNGTAWIEMGLASASNGGISLDSGCALTPSLAMDSSGNPVVAWVDYDIIGGDQEIYLRRWIPFP